ncbi:NAD-dependent epimerase/dehydratase family protein [Streptomyces sp. AJS327]|uniref:NAD-dependent epimerase/dehydratase family protein n=1 Tax=Streptomyces sp. AJS327 TaxID=2545265 RepID=UPI0015DDBCC5|nr:NAD-dependent epimerase/dehydratase family protein [Streptomyces sp. AJS327]MBA0051173.1 NAD-dependent epimerase/dehydratase family protein [Streptomyces sp. AJS327]
MTSDHALVLGATGQLGRAVVSALHADGWRVTAASRGGGRDPHWPEEVGELVLDRDAPGALAAAVGSGRELLFDCTAQTPAHARQVAGLTGRLGSAVVVSSAAVYADGAGRSLGGETGFPTLPVPVTERQRTVPPGDGSYEARKALLERELLALGERLPVTLLRAAALHGPYCRTPRELYFVQRWLDGRRARVLAFGGRSRFHTAHVANVAELVRLAARTPGSRVLNAADPEALTVREIAEAIDAVLSWECETVPLDGPPPPGEPTVGRTPWSLPEPLVLDMTAAERELGYRPVSGYAASLPATVEWLADHVRGRDWRAVLPEMAAAYDPMGDLFDYAAEDRWSRSTGRAPG